MPKDKRTSVRTARSKVARARSAFAHAHQRAMASIKRGDYRGFARAVEDEGTAIRTVDDAIDAAKAEGKRKR